MSAFISNYFNYFNVFMKRLNSTTEFCMIITLTILLGVILMYCGCQTQQHKLDYYDNIPLDKVAMLA